MGSKVEALTVSENVRVISATSNATEKLSSWGAVVSGVKIATCRALSGVICSAKFSAESITIPSAMLTNVVVEDVATSEITPLSGEEVHMYQCTQHDGILHVYPHFHHMV